MHATKPVPIIRAAGDGDRQAFLGGGLHTWKLLAEDTGDAFFLFEDAMGKGKRTPLHRHPEADELTYVLEGELVLNVDGTETRLGTGGMSFVPRGTPHAFLVVSDSARLLTMQTPGVGQAFYRGASEPTTEDTSDTLDLTRLRSSAEHNPRGIELLGPPPFDAAGG
jgi:quercetin dioxygenase-like cupin family protein